MPTLGFGGVSQRSRVPESGTRGMEEAQTERVDGIWRVFHLQLPSLLNLSQPPSTERNRLRTIIRTMVAMTTGVDFVSIFSTDCKERGSLK